MKKLVAYSLIIFLSISCSQDRLKPLNGEGEKKLVYETNSMPFVASKGTEVYIDINKFMKKKDGSDVSFPFEIEIIELLTPGDIIRYGKPTVSDGKLLSTGGEIFIKITKDGDELILKNYNYLKINIPSENPDPDMLLFSGEENADGTLNWKQEPEWVTFQCVGSISESPGLPNNCRESGDRTLTVNGEKYELFTNELGWINCDRFLKDEGPLTSIQFGSLNKPMDAIQLYLFFPDINSIIGVFNGKSLQVPIGQPFTYVAIAKQTNDLVYTDWKEGLVVEENQKIELNLKETALQSLLDFLDNL